MKRVDEAFPSVKGILCIISATFAEFAAKQ